MSVWEEALQTLRAEIERRDKTIAAMKVISDAQTKAWKVAHKQSEIMLSALEEIDELDYRYEDEYTREARRITEDAIAKVKGESV